MTKITAKQEAFCLAYLETNNASEAYRRTYSVDRMKSETVNRRAFDVLQNGNVTARVSALRAAVVENAVLEATRIMTEIRRIAHSSIKGLMHDDGRVKLPHELDDATAAAVKSFKIDEYGRIEYQFWDKVSALDKAAKILGLYELDNKQKTDPLRELLNSLNGNVHGVVLDVDQSGYE